jgi:hypothetical protein
MTIQVTATRSSQSRVGGGDAGVAGDRVGSGLAVGDGKPFGTRRDVAELAAKMGGKRRHVSRAEYNARAYRLGGAIAVNLIEPACKTGISYGHDVAERIPMMLDSMNCMPLLPPLHPW